MSLSLRRTAPSTARRRFAAISGVAVLACAALSACEAAGGSPSAAPAEQTEETTATETPAPLPVSVHTNVSDPSSVAIDHELRVQATGGTLSSVKVTSSAGSLTGTLSGGSWRATGRLEPGTDYVVRTVATDSAGERVRRRSRFHTQDLTLDQQTYPSVAPLQGETVGIGMPVIVTFDLPVSDKSTFEKHMSVTSTPKQPGSWHWISDTEAHWRPKSYWKAGTDVAVDVDINSVPAGNGIYGQEDREVSFHVGEAVVSKVNAQTHQMQTFINGKLAKTTPITTGKAGFTTRSGVKVIIEKFRHKTMRSETIGISDESSSDYYDLDDVEYAMRVTYSGEFLHAAPWSVGSQGYANVSHGCTGMSTANAKWIYDHSKRGDVVEYTGTDRGMTLTNGYGDWNLSFGAYRKGSALS